MPAPASSISRPATARTTSSWASPTASRCPTRSAEDGSYYPHVPLFAGKRVFTSDGKKGDANARVIEALTRPASCSPRAASPHSYPHSWRSKAPVIFRNTPQWFIAMDKPIAEIGGTLRETALAAIDATRFVPRAGDNRIRAMVEARPDWCVSRQRAWGVPIAIFVDKETGEPLRDPEVDGAHRRGVRGRGRRRLVRRARPSASSATSTRPRTTSRSPTSSTSGSIPARPMSSRSKAIPTSKWPADLYLEGSDQHRGWFQSSLLESCGTRGRAPYDGVLTHGFVLDEQGRKMSKSLGNIIAPQEVCDQNGADILRLWVVAHRLHRRPAHRPGDPASTRPRPIAGCATPSATCWAPRRLRRAERVEPERHAGARALGAAPPGRARRRGAARRSTISTSTASPPRCTISAPTTCRRSTSTSARTRSTATRPIGAAPARRRAP